jgi:hypothetical protein
VDLQVLDTVGVVILIQADLAVRALSNANSCIDVLALLPRAPLVHSLDLLQDDGPTLVVRVPGHLEVVDV